MKLNSLFIDKFAISISALCVVHCLVFPALAVLLPSFTAFGFESEAFHLWMVVTVIPTSIYALTLGCKKHANISIFIIGFIGLSFLLAALIFGERQLSELGEKLLTLIGALIIATAHFKNYKLCQQDKTCACPQHKA